MKNQIITIVALVALMFSFASCGGSSSPGEVAVKHTEYIKNEKYDAYVDALYKSPEDKKDAVALEKQSEELTLLLEAKIKESLKKKDGIKDIVLVSEEISEDGKTAVVVIKITYGNGEESDDTVNMILDEDGDWKTKLSK